MVLPAGGGLAHAFRRPPRCLVLGSVRGFERSAPQDALVAALRRLCLRWRELLLSPGQLGVPNSRTRYYLLARRRPFPFAAPPDGQVLEELPYCVCGPAVPAEHTCRLCDKPALAQLSECLACRWDSGRDDTAGPVPPPLSLFLADVTPSDTSSLLLPGKLLSRYGVLLDIVLPDSRRSCCLEPFAGQNF